MDNIEENKKNTNYDMFIRLNTRSKIVYVLGLLANSPDCETIIEAKELLRYIVEFD